MTIRQYNIFGDEPAVDRSSNKIFGIYFRAAQVREDTAPPPSRETPSARATGLRAPRVRNAAAITAGRQGALANNEDVRVAPTIRKTIFLSFDH